MKMQGSETWEDSAHEHRLLRGTSQRTDVLRSNTQVVFCNQCYAIGLRWEDYDQIWQRVLFRSHVVTLWASIRLSYEDDMTTTDMEHFWMKLG